MAVLRGRSRIAVLGRGSAVASKRMRAMWVGVRDISLSIWMERRGEKENERKRERERGRTRHRAACS